MAKPAKPKPKTAKAKPMAGDTLGIYTGEFLVSPVPLELSFNWCSHHCLYCFANLNRPDRQADVKATSRLLADYRNRDTLTAHLLREGYPVLVSNRVDPFAASNYRQSLPILKVMAGLGIPVAIQTRGGFGVDEAMIVLPPSVWYVSITTLDDDIRKRLEPGAPTTDSRFDLIERLRARGHRVVIGHNPCVKEWQPDPSPLMERAADCGAEGVVIAELHLSQKQAARLSPRDREAIGEDLIARTRKRCRPDDHAHCRLAADAARAAGLNAFVAGDPSRVDFVRPYRECYPKTFPVFQDLVNDCHDWGLTPSDIINADEFVDYFADRLPSGTWSDMSRYIGATSKDVLRDNPCPSRMTYRELLRVVIGDRRCAFHPARHAALSHPAKWDGDGWIELKGRDGQPLFGFSPAGFDDSYYEFDGFDAATGRGESQ